ncbi:hypothetical protein B0I35DRAFT_485567 [Stachybotrys elegans]|uniref:Uncharacterized protein n=1 Tax=Stachybotrys elegans TaxID=80388 RepID=A0A8K0WK25_9HYPO|nr:hypothetical protein B0I35DRAFT_485567 [Stachybotrys elegans]
MRVVWKKTPFLGSDGHGNYYSTQFVSRDALDIRSHRNLEPEMLSFQAFVQALGRPPHLGEAAGTCFEVAIPGQASTWPLYSEESFLRFNRELDMFMATEKTEEARAHAVEITVHVGPLAPYRAENDVEGQEVEQDDSDASIPMQNQPEGEGNELHSGRDSMIEDNSTGKGDDVDLSDDDTIRVAQQDSGTPREGAGGSPPHNNDNAEGETNLAALDNDATGKGNGEVVPGSDREETESDLGPDRLWMYWDEACDFWQRNPNDRTSTFTLPEFGLPVEPLSAIRVFLVVKATSRADIHTISLSHQEMIFYLAAVAHVWAAVDKGVVEDLGGARGEIIYGLIANRPRCPTLICTRDKKDSEAWADRLARWCGASYISEPILAVARLGPDVCTGSYPVTGSAVSLRSLQPDIFIPSTIEASYPTNPSLAELRETGLCHMLQGSRKGQYTPDRMILVLDMESIGENRFRQIFTTKATLSGAQHTIDIHTMVSLAGLCRWDFVQTDGTHAQDPAPANWLVLLQECSDPKRTLITHQKGLYTLEDMNPALRV